MTQEMGTLVGELRKQEAVIRLGGGDKAIARQHEKGRLTAQSRLFTAMSSIRHRLSPQWLARTGFFTPPSISAIGATLPRTWRALPSTARAMS